MKIKIIVLLSFIFCFIVPIFAQNDSLVVAYKDGDILETQLGKHELKFIAAVTNAAKMKGLSKRKTIPQNGMVFLFDKKQSLSFWMKDMLISIDIVWVGNGRVLGFYEDVPPEPGISLTELIRYYSPQDTDTVLELPAGAVSKMQIKKGDKFIIKANLGDKNDK